MASNLEKSPIAGLTPRQRKILRLVYELRTTKEIAAQLEVSTHTVDADIKRAIKLLCSSGRGDAARIFAKFEAENPESEDWYYQSSDLPELLEPGIPPSSVQTESEADAGGIQDDPTLHKPECDIAEAHRGLGPVDQESADLAATSPFPAGSDRTRRDDLEGRAWGASNDLKVRSRRVTETDAPKREQEARGRERQPTFRNRFGGLHDLSILKKIGIILASAFALITVISAGLASLNSISELCVTAHICEWPRVNQPKLVQPTKLAGEQDHEKRHDRNGSE